MLLILNFDKIDIYTPSISFYFFQNNIVETLALKDFHTVNFSSSTKKKIYK